MYQESMSSHEAPRQVPVGFSSVADLNRSYQTNHPETAQAYKAQGLTVPKPGEFAQNNGVLVLVDFEGKMRAMIPISDPRRKKESEDRFNAPPQIRHRKVADEVDPVSSWPVVRSGGGI